LLILTDDVESPNPRTLVLDALLMAAVAAAVRSWYLLELAGDPFWTGLVSNPASYHQEAQWVAQGHRLPVSSGFQPLYGTLIGVIYAVAGPSVGAVRALHVLLAASIAGMITWMGARWVSRGAGLLGGLLWALYWPSIYYGGELLPDVLVTAGVLAALLFATRALHNGGWGGWALSGLCLGTVCLAKPNALLLAPMVWLAAALWPGQDRRQRRNAVLAASLVVVGAVAGTQSAPLLFDGYSPAITRAFSMKVIWDGNHARADGTNPFYAEFPGVDEWAIWDDPDDYEAIGDAFRSDLLDTIRDEPGTWLRLMGRKCVVYLSAQEVDGNSNVAWRRARSTMLGLPLWSHFGLMFALGLAGLVHLSSRWRQHLLPVLWALVWSASIVIIQVNGRYRLPCAGITAIYAGVGGWAVWTALAARQWRQLIALGAAMLLGAVLSCPDYLGLRDYAIAELVYQESLVLEHAGRLDEAETHYHDGLHLQFGGPKLETRLGLFLAHHGRVDEALVHMRSATERLPTRASLHKDLGATLRDAGRPAEALESFERAAALDPDDAGLAYNVGLALVDLGRSAEAVEAFDRAEALGHDDPQLLLMRGVALARLSSWARAEQDLSRAAADDRLRCQARANLRQLYQVTGRPQLAVEAWAPCADPSAGP